MAIARALEGDKPVALFPEGTTGPGTQLLPFRSTLLEAANFAAKDVEDPARRHRLRRSAAARSAGMEESGKDNVLRMLGRQGNACPSPSMSYRRSIAPATASSWPMRRAMRSPKRSLQVARATRL